METESNRIPFDSRHMAFYRGKKWIYMKSKVIEIYALSVHTEQMVNVAVFRHNLPSFSIRYFSLQYIAARISEIVQ